MASAASHAQEAHRRALGLAVRALARVAQAPVRRAFRRWADGTLRGEVERLRRHLIDAIERAHDRGSPAGLRDKAAANAAEAVATAVGAAETRHGNAVRALREAHREELRELRAALREARRKLEQRELEFAAVAEEQGDTVAQQAARVEATVGDLEAAKRRMEQSTLDDRRQLRQRVLQSGAARLVAVLRGWRARRVRHAWTRWSMQLAHLRLQSIVRTRDSSTIKTLQRKLEQRREENTRLKALLAELTRLVHTKTASAVDRRAGEEAARPRVQPLSSQARAAAMAGDASVDTRTDDEQAVFRAESPMEPETPSLMHQLRSVLGEDAARGSMEDSSAFDATETGSSLLDTDNGTSRSEVDSAREGTHSRGTSYERSRHGRARSHGARSRGARSRGARSRRSRSRRSRRSRRRRRRARRGRSRARTESSRGGASRSDVRTATTSRSRYTSPTTGTYYTSGWSSDGGSDDDAHRNHHHRHAPAAHADGGSAHVRSQRSSGAAVAALEERGGAWPPDGPEVLPAATYEVRNAGAQPRKASATSGRKGKRQPRSRRTRTGAGRGTKGRPPADSAPQRKPAVPRFSTTRSGKAKARRGKASTTRGGRTQTRASRMRWGGGSASGAISLDGDEQREPSGPTGDDLAAVLAEAFPTAAAAHAAPPAQRAAPPPPSRAERERLLEAELLRRRSQRRSSSAESASRAQEPLPPPPPPPPPPPTLSEVAATLPAETPIAGSPNAMGGAQHAAVAIAFDEAADSDGSTSTSGGEV